MGAQEAVSGRRSLAHLPLPNLLMDLLGEGGCLGKHEDSGGEAVKPVKRVELLQVMLLA